MANILKTKSKNIESQIQRLAVSMADVPGDVRKLKEDVAILKEDMKVVKATLTHIGPQVTDH